MESQPSARLCVSLGQAGDRLDSEILELSETLADVAPDHIILRQMAGYERGRQPAEVAELIRRGLLERSYPPERVAIVEGELTALDEAMTWAGPVISSCCWSISSEARSPTGSASAAQRIRRPLTSPRDVCLA